VSRIHRVGRTQVVFEPGLADQSHKQSHLIRDEWVLAVRGKVAKRPEGTVNAKIPTGEIEVAVKTLEVHNMAEVLPFPVDDPEVAKNVNEELRLQYRYLDLRRPEMTRNLRLRSKVATATRVFFDEQGFLEVETPTLFKSTPEGAREFIVPARLHPGKFYALPQSPQQFKQILMVAGIEKYFQLARCYRDEDLRADRQPEFTQIDIEMSFIEREDIYKLIEGLLARVWKTALNIDIPVPFKRISFDEALNRYGIDKPDTRYGIELADFTEEFRSSTFKVFSGAIAAGGVVAVHAETTLQLDGQIDVSAKGFQGGAAPAAKTTAAAGSGIVLYSSATETNGAQKGESIAGYQSDYNFSPTNGQYGRGAPANGGGGGDSHNAGGGGGANGQNGKGGGSGVIIIRYPYP